MAYFGVVEGHVAATVQGEIELAICSTQRLTELGMIQDGDPHARQRLAIPSEHPASDDGCTPRLDRTRHDTRLDWVVSAVEKRRRDHQPSRDGSIERRRYRRRI